MYATFYRDPYCDVSISALDAAERYVAAGTNFMDGKLYLFSENGKLLWKHQFATIASLGWRPEDVTAVKIGRQYVAVGTEFTNEYLHVYTTTRKRVLEKKVRGRVEDIAFMGERLVVGTDSYLYNFDINRGREHIIDTPAKKVEILNDIIIAINNYGVIAFKPSANGKIKKYWRVKSGSKFGLKSGSKGSEFCIAKNGFLLASENELQSISPNGEIQWSKKFDVKIDSLYFDKISDKIYVGMDGKLKVLSPRGESIKDFKVDGKVVKVGRFRDVVALVWNEGLTLYKL